MPNAIKENYLHRWYRWALVLVASLAFAALSTHLAFYTKLLQWELNAYCVLLVPPLVFLCAYWDLMQTGQMDSSDGWFPSWRGLVAIACLLTYASLTVAHKLGYHPSFEAFASLTGKKRAELLETFAPLMVFALVMLHLILDAVLLVPIRFALRLFASAGPAESHVGAVLLGAGASVLIYGTYHFDFVSRILRALSRS